MADVADTQQILHSIQSIPSPKAEFFKLWLAEVGRERIEETIDPTLKEQKPIRLLLFLFNCYIVGLLV